VPSNLIPIAALTQSIESRSIDMPLRVYRHCNALHFGDKHTVTGHPSNAFSD